MPFLRILLSTAVLTALVLPPRALADTPPAASVPPAGDPHDARMAWWRDAKFGMFIHWGVYAVPAGIHEGKPIKGIGEWIMSHDQIPVQRYRQYAASFNPAGYDPEAWAQLAKNAGMRYLIITAKHHDGFALFPSDVSDWDIADATPWKKDLLAPLAGATRAQGLKFGLYYSQAQDWVHPGGAKAGYKEGNGWDPAQQGNFDHYLQTIAAPQVGEILDRYQPDILWWDTPQWMTPRRASPFAELLSHHPDIISNDRLGGGFQGDLTTPEQYIPSVGISGKDWESCMTINDTWGYKSTDHNWKSSSTLIRNLIDIVSKGGNYLLNVGPDANGNIPQESVDRLLEVGAWLETNGEAIYATSASPFKRLPWGRCTTRRGDSNTTLYLHIFNWPHSGKLQLRGLTNPVTSASLLATGTAVEFESSDDGPVFNLPTRAPDTSSSTLKVTISGIPAVTEIPVAPDSRGTITLLPEDAIMSSPGVTVESRRSGSNLGYWHNPKHTVEWLVESPTSGKYTVEIETAAPYPGSVIRLQGAGKLAFPVPKTTSYHDYTLSKMGEIHLNQQTPTRLRLIPVIDAWNPVNVRKILLTPAP